MEGKKRQKKEAEADSSRLISGKFSKKRELTYKACLGWPIGFELAHQNLFIVYIQVLYTLYIQVFFIVYIQVLSGLSCVYIQMVSITYCYFKALSIDSF